MAFWRGIPFPFQTMRLAEYSYMRRQLQNGRRHFEESVHTISIFIAAMHPFMTAGMQWPGNRLDTAVDLVRSKTYHRASAEDLLSRWTSILLRSGRVALYLYPLKKTIPG